MCRYGGPYIARSICNRCRLVNNELSVFLGANRIVHPSVDPGDWSLPDPFPEIWRIVGKQSEGICPNKFQICPGPCNLAAITASCAKVHGASQPS